MVMFLDSHGTVVLFRFWLDIVGVVLAFWNSIAKDIQITSKLHTYHELRKTFGKFIRSYTEL